MKTVLLFTQNYEKSSNEIIEEGGQVTQKFTDTVFVAKLAEDLEISTLKYSFQKPEFELDKLSNFMVQAWRDLESEQRIQTDQEDEEEHQWDDEGFQNPKNPDNDEQLKKEFEDDLKSLGIEQLSTSEKMTGNIALGLIIVSGKNSGLKISDSEQRSIVKSAMRGCQLLANIGVQDNVCFNYDVRLVTIKANPNNKCGSYKDCEAVFRDPALNELGYPKTYQGCVDYVNDLRAHQKADWACMGFITKYPLYHFAYASGVRFCIEYNDRWKSIDVYKTFSHEICHIFGAADEYGKCTCKTYGYYNVPNRNCVNCTKDQHHCLMGGGGKNLTLCKWSRGQLGLQAFKTRGNLDAALMRNNGKIYFFKGNQYNRFSSVPEGVDKGYPRAIAGIWPRLPKSFQQGIDAVFTRESNEKIYMFKDDQYVRYSEVPKGVDKGYPKPIAGNWPGLPESFQMDIDAVLMRKSNGKIYIFKDDQYIRYSEVSKGVDKGYPKPIAGNWPDDLPDSFKNGIDTAFTREANGKIYFFKGDQYLRLSEDDSRVDTGYPRPINGNWFPFKL